MEDISDSTTWSEEKDEILIEMWALRECLYDVTSRGFSNRQLRTQSLEECSSVLGIPVKDITKRMTTLRTQYSRLLKPLPSGSNFKQKTARQEWLLRKMEFLAPHVKARTSVSNLQINPVQQSQMTEINSEGCDEARGPEAKVPSSEPPATPQSLIPSQSSSHQQRKKRKMLEHEEANLVQSLQKALEEPEEDEDSTFAKYLVCEMKQIKDDRTKLILRREIQNLVFEARISQLD